MTHAISIERIRSEIWNTLVHGIVSNPALWGTVDVADVRSVMADALAAVPEQPLDLRPFWARMAATGTPREAAIATTLAVWSHVQRRGVDVTLPPDLEQLALEEKQSAADAAAERTRAAAEFAPTRFGKKGKRTEGIAAQIVLWASRAAIVAACVTCAAAFAHQAARDSAEVRHSLGDACVSAEVYGRAALCVMTGGLDDDVAQRRAILAARETAERFSIEVVVARSDGGVIEVARPASSGT